MHVVGFNRHFIEDLFIESDSAGCPTHVGQQPVVETITSTQPAAMQVKGRPGNKDKVKVGG